MKCDDCGESIAGTFFQCEGKNICERDYEQKYRKKCSVCGAGISGSYYTDTDGKIICATDYKAQHGGSLDCRKCGGEVGGLGEIVRAVGAVFHPGCFACCKCGKNLASKDAQFLADEQKRIYCRVDYYKEFAPKCEGCRQPIAPRPGEKSTSSLKVMGKDWHPNCFKCADCQETLGGASGKKCYPMDEVPLCMECHKNRL